MHSIRILADEVIPARFIPMRGEEPMISFASDISIVSENIICRDGSLREVMTKDKQQKAVALLRGINVGGKNLLPMKALAEIFAAAGSTEVKTYIQSGNVVFRAARPDSVAAQVRNNIEAQFGLKVPVVVRSAAELAGILTANPFLHAGIDVAWLHVMFLEHAPAPAQIAALDPERSPPDKFAVHGRDVYLHLPNGAAKTKLTNAYFDSKLKTVSTQRNWRTVITLAELVRE